MTFRCLVELDGATAPEAVRAHVEELVARLGPGARIDLRWSGELDRALPPGVRLLPRGSGARALAGAAVRAGAEGGHLVVLLGPVRPDRAALEALASAFELDPLVGFAQPRFAEPSGEIWSLPEGASREAWRLPPSLAAGLPERYLTTELLAACLVVRREVAAWFTASPDGGEGLAAALAAELCQARRRGHRNVVMNRVVVPSELPPGALYPTLDAASASALEQRFPDSLQAAEWFRDESHVRFEQVAARSRRPPPSRRAVLFDCRGAGDRHNGTSQAIFGLLDGLRDEAPPWDVEILFGAEGAAYHGVARRYPEMALHTRLPDATYAAAVRLDQPWGLSTIAELHSRSAAVAFNMLDTIAWDIVYAAPPGLGTVWRLVARHADGLLYNSAFTRARFDFRFGVDAGVAEVVTHHSLDPEEHRDPAAAALPAGEHLLVFGNRYDHKAVNETTELLHRAFPYRPIRVVGGRPAPALHNVKVLESGHLDAAEIDRLFATASVVVFPSHYEGFGLPVVKALAYGRTVVVRASPLWRELADLMRMPGRLVEFVAAHDLVEAVGGTLAGEVPPGALALGAELAGRPPPRWRDCARAMVELVERIAAGADARRWCARDEALRRAGA